MSSFSFACVVGSGARLGFFVINTTLGAIDRWVGKVRPRRPYQA
jgi:hypothetical protein